MSNKVEIERVYKASYVHLNVKYGGAAIRVYKDSDFGTFLWSPVTIGWSSYLPEGLSFVRNFASLLQVARREAEALEREFPAGTSSEERMQAIFDEEKRFLESKP